VGFIGRQAQKVDQVAVMDAKALKQGVLHDRVIAVVAVHELAGHVVEHSRLVEQVLLSESAQAVRGWTLAGHGQSQPIWMTPLHDDAGTKRGARLSGAAPGPVRSGDVAFGVQAVSIRRAVRRLSCIASASSGAESGPKARRSSAWTVRMTG
jgi:hypothetical protein